MKGGRVVATWQVIAIIAFLAGGVGGWCWRINTQHDRFMEALIGSYQTQKQLMEAQTAQAITELGTYRKSMNIVKGAARNGTKKN